MSTYSISTLTFLNAEGAEIEVAAVKVTAIVRANFSKKERIIRFAGTISPELMAKQALRQAKLDLNAYAQGYSNKVAKRDRLSEVEKIAVYEKLMEAAQDTVIDFARPRIVSKSENIRQVILRLQGALPDVEPAVQKLLRQQIKDWQKKLEE